MRLEDGEVIFGKRWNTWNQEEIIEFLSVVTEQELRNPAVLGMAVENLGALPYGPFNLLMEWLSRSENEE